MPSQGIGHFSDITFAIHPALIDQTGNSLVIFWLQITKRQVFQLPFQLTYTQPMCQWCINIKNFTRNTATFLISRGFYGTDGTGTLGKFD